MAREQLNEELRRYAAMGEVPNASANDETLMDDFFGKNQFNLAKRLIAAQVHDSDTPSPFSQRLGGEWAVNHDIQIEKHVDSVDILDARPHGLWSSDR